MGEGGAVHERPVGAPADDGSWPELAEFLRTHVPKGGSVSEDPPKVFHTVTANESVASIAGAYLSISAL